MISKKALFFYFRKNRYIGSILYLVSSSYDTPLILLYEMSLGAVHKLHLQEEGGRWSKRSTFCKLLYNRKCKRRGVGGQKKTNLVNVVCERPLRM